MTEIETIYRNFEKKHKNILQDQQKISDFAFYYPRETWDFTDISKDKSNELYMGYCQGAYLSGLMPDMVFDDEDFLKHNVIVLINIKMISDSILKKLNNFIAKGRKLIIIGEAGIKDQDGIYRKEKIFDENNDNIIWYKSKEFVKDFYDGFDSNRFSRNEIRLENPKLITKQMSENQGRQLRDNILNPAIKDKNTSELILTTIYETKDEKNIIIHIVNAENILTSEKETIGHNDIIENFKDKQPCNKKIQFSIIKIDDLRLETAVFISPEYDDEKKVQAKRDNNNRIEINIPEKTFSSYGFVKISK